MRIPAFDQTVYRQKLLLNISLIICLYEYMNKLHIYILYAIARLAGLLGLWSLKALKRQGCHSFNKLLRLFRLLGNLNDYVCAILLIVEIIDSDYR